ncbi:MAG: TonB-dependent receptor domain-containing protein, partial [Methylophilaceae bacterium]
MKQTTIASLIGLLFSPSIFAANTTVQTTDVVVTASRVSQTRESVISDVTVINSAEIERAGQSTFLELMQTQPGIEVSSNGGAGKTTSLFMRGTNPNHVVVLIDGIRVSSATSGTTTFENIPLAQIDKVEILRGPATSLYGQDAIGGVIQIFTKQGGGAPRFNASVGYGSYNTKTAEAGIRGSTGDTRFSLNASSSDTNGFSAKRFRSGVQGDNDGYRNLSFNGSVSHRIAEGHEIGMQILSSEGRSRYDNSNTFSNYADLSQLSYSIFSKNQLTSYWSSTMRLGEGIDDYVDHSAPNTRGKFKTKQAQYSWQNDFTLPIGTLTLLYDRLEQRVVSSTDYDRNSRNNDGFTGSYLLNLGAHSLQASYRSDHNSQFGTNDTGGIGYGFSFTPNWRATASYGTAFKAPTFNDLYFPGFSNPDLKPEKSRNAEASLRYENTTGNASLTIYENKIRDLIAFDFTAAPFVFNLNQANIQGMTLAAAQRWDSWLLKGSLDVQSPRDTETDNLLVRRANRHASINLSREWGAWR